jgi:hypothetical protein
MDIVLGEAKSVECSGRFSQADLEISDRLNPPMLSGVSQKEGILVDRHLGP